MVKENYFLGCGALGRSLGACEDTESSAARQPGRLSEEVKFGLGLKNKDLYKGRCTRAHSSSTQTWVVSRVYLLYSPSLKLTHTNVDMGIHSMVQSYRYTKAQAITQCIDKRIYTYMRTGSLLPTQIHKTNDIQPP